jgi:WD40 repeat protein
MLPGHRKSAYCVAFSPDSKLLFSGGEDGTVRQWDVVGHREISPPLQHEWPVAFLAVSRDGRVVATACFDNYLRLWDRASRQMRKLRYGPAEVVVAPAFSPDGRWLAFGTGNNIRIWDLKADQEKTVLRGAAGGIINLRFTLDGKRLVSASELERPVLWDLDRPEKVATIGGFQEGIYSMTVSADSRLLAVGSGAFFKPALPGEVRVFDLASQQLLMPPLEHPQAVNSVALAPDGRLLVNSCEDGHARVFALPEGQLLRTLTNAVLNKRAPMNNARALALSPDGQTLVTSMSSPRQLALWNTTTWQSKPLLRDPPGGPQKFAFSPDGSLLVTPLGAAKAAIIWNMPSGTTNRVLELDTNARGAAISHDGRVVALNTFVDILLFEVKTGKPLGTLKGHEHVIEGLAFTADGKTLASAGLDGVRLWSVPALAEVAVLHDHQGAAEAVTFTGDGQWLISGGRDKTVKLRRLPSFAEIQALEGATATGP